MRDDLNKECGPRRLRAEQMAAKQTAGGLGCIAAVLIILFAIVLALAPWAAWGATMVSQELMEMRLASLRADLASLMKTQSVYVVQKNISMSYGTTNGVAITTYAYGEGANRMTFTVEEASVYALCATNATAAAVSAGVTNGMYFVWNGANHSYTNHEQVITATPSNLVWNAVQSDGGSFTNLFDVLGAMLQPSMAGRLTR